MTRSFSLKNHQSSRICCRTEALSNLWTFPASHYCATNWHIRKQIKITAQSSTAMVQILQDAVATLQTPWTFKCLQHSALHNNLVVVKYRLQCESSKTNQPSPAARYSALVTSSSNKQFVSGSWRREKQLNSCVAKSERNFADAVFADKICVFFAFFDSRELQPSLGFTRARNSANSAPAK